jgi:pentose-5-phosphate-3-epimerase
MAALEPVQHAAPILSANLSRLGEQVEEAIKAGIQLIHVDLKDGLFVFSIRRQPSQIHVDTAIDTINTRYIFNLMNIISFSTQGVC